MGEVSARRQEHKLRLMNDLLCEGQEIIISWSGNDCYEGVTRVGSVSRFDPNDGNLRVTL